MEKEGKSHKKGKSDNKKSKENKKTRIGGSGKIEEKWESNNFKLAKIGGFQFLVTIFSYFQDFGAFYSVAGRPGRNPTMLKYPLVNQIL